jgi:hypothetical protein
MAQNKSNGISLANIIAVIGIVLLAVFIFLGYLYGGDVLGISILKAAAWAVGFSLLLFLLIKAKTAETDTGKWKIIEGLLLVAYIVCAVLSSNRVARFATIYSTSDDLKAEATEDIGRIREAVALFKSNENAALTNTVTGLELAALGESTPELLDFADQNGFELNSQSISNFKAKWQDRIENVTDNEQNSYSDAWEDALTRNGDLIQSWSVMKIPEAANAMKDFAPQVTAKLEEISATLPFPVIYKNEEDISEINKPHEAGQYPIEATFADTFFNKSSYSVVGIILCVVLHAMVLFNYLIAYRTKRRRPQKNVYVNDGGMSI